MEVRSTHDAADEQRFLDAPEPPTCIGGAAREIPEHVVERPNRAAEESRAPLEQCELDAVDVRPVRHDEQRLEPVRGLERLQITVEQKLDLARIGRPRNQPERHPPTLALHSAGETSGLDRRDDRTPPTGDAVSLPLAPC